MENLTAAQQENENNTEAANQALGDNSQKKKGDKLADFFKTVVLPFMIAAMVTIALGYCFRIIKVKGTSMLDTYKDGKLVIANHIGYILNGEKVSRGDVVVIKASKSIPYKIIKRVIAVGGDTVDIDFESGTVTVNGEILDEPYIKEPTHNDGKAFEYPVVVPEDCFFVMGDNRNASLDSRFPDVGFINKHDILGAVL